MGFNDIKMYEKLPNLPFPVRILDFSNNPYQFPAHWHEHTEIHFFFKNGGILRYGEEYITLCEGDCVIINGNELHGGAGCPDGLCNYVCLILPPSFFENNHIIFHKVIRDAYVKELVEQIYHKNQTHSSIDMLEVKGILYLLVAYLIRTHTFKSLAETVYSKYFNKLNRINEATSYISQHYDEPLTTRLLADIFHLSEGYFCQIFKEVTGKTAVEYINHFRVEKARQLLQKTDMTVTEIAFCCGFNNANYFARIYQKISGKSPRAERAD